jgi:hypothetical protein
LSSDVSIKVCCSFEKWVHEFDMQLHFSRPWTAGLSYMSDR